LIVEDGLDKVHQGVVGEDEAMVQDSVPAINDDASPAFAFESWD
jgi:hypothetical protein